MYLVVDTSSPIASLALGAARAESHEARTLPQKQTSEALLATIDELLTTTRISLGELDGLVGLRGPGSFTGLRIGLATLFGLHQAVGVRAAAPSTLAALGAVPNGAGLTLGLVDALRTEWFAQTFRRGAPAPPIAQPEIVAGERLADLEVDHYVGFGLADSRWAERLPAPRLERISTPRNLASSVLTKLRPEHLVWDADELLEPLYLRPPATTRPKTLRQT